MKLGHYRAVHTCGRSTENDVFCWGSNDFGQLGDGSTTTRLTPTRLAGRFTTITLGSLHTCGLTEAGEARCWGRSGSGQLGDGSVEDRTTPTPVAGGDQFDALAAGGSHTCAMRRGVLASVVLCWGNNTVRQLGRDGESSSVPVPVEDRFGRISKITAGGSHTCVLQTQTALPDAPGQVKCWGSSEVVGADPPASVPSIIAPSQPWIDVSAEAFGAHTCAVGADGSVFGAAGPAFCWGLDFFGAGVLGDGTTVSRQTPVPVQGGLRFRSVAAGTRHSCGITIGGDAYCWGSNEFGQFGDGTTTSSVTPTRLGRWPDVADR